MVFTGGFVNRWALAPGLNWLAISLKTQPMASVKIESECTSKQIPREAQSCPLDRGFQKIEPGRAAPD